MRTRLTNNIGGLEIELVDELINIYFNCAVGNFVMIATNVQINTTQYIQTLPF